VPIGIYAGVRAAAPVVRVSLEHDALAGAVARDVVGPAGSETIPIDTPSKPAGVNGVTIWVGPSH
jgi:hypothetical protein